MGAKWFGASVSRPVSSQRPAAARSAQISSARRMNSCFGSASGGIGPLAVASIKSVESPPRSRYCAPCTPPR